MFSFLKRSLIPNEENDHKPHFLRHEAVVAVLLVIVFVEVAFISSVFLIFKSSDFIAAVLPKALVVITNEERIKNSEKTLIQNDLLTKAAKLKADDMALRGYFSHKTPEGKDPWIFLDKVGYNYSYAGENLAINFLDSKDVVDAWLSSPTHRGNLLSTNYKEIGIATAEGVYQGKNSTFVVQFFATPAPASSASADEAGVPITSSIPTTPTVAGAEVSPGTSMTNTNSLAAKVPISLSAPRQIMDYLLWFMAGFALLSLLLAIFVKINIQYGEIIMNGITVIFFALALFALNHYFFKTPGGIPAEASGASVTRAF